MVDNFNEYVTVKCNKCGNEMGFFPMRVVHLRGCKCGNDDYGSPRHWKDDNFGNFTLVKKEEWNLEDIRYLDPEARFEQSVGKLAIFSVKRLFRALGL